MELFIYTLAVYGLAWGLSCSKVGQALRRWVPPLRPLLSCIACTSFWASSVVTLALWDGLPNFTSPAWKFLGMGLYSVATTWLIGKVAGDAD